MHGFRVNRARNASQAGIALSVALIALGGGLSCLLAACSVELGSTDQAIVACPNWACAQNGPTLNNRDFHELAENGDPNAEGFHLGTMLKAGTSYTMRVSGHRLYGIAANNTTISGAALVGASFTVLDAANHAIRIHINGVAVFPMWGGPFVGAAVESYRLEWVDDMKLVRNLCANPPVEKPASSELLGMRGEYTLMFEGDRYDAKRKLVLPGDRNWFNLACAGHALSKLFLTGHTSGSGFATPDEQQTVLKNLTADYCGDGTSFTVGGEPLYWKTSNSYMKYFATPTTLEARWDSKGASCLGQPRLKTSKSAVAAAVFPDINAAIDAQCAATRPPPCPDPDLNDLAGAIAVSANPLNE
jgi:ADYC domain